MSTPSTVLFLPLPHGAINGNLASQDGVICFIAKNYTKLYLERPEKPVDENTHLYRVLVRDEDLVVRENNGADEYLLWLGEKNSSQRPHEKATLPIISVELPAALGSGEAPADKIDPVDAARLAYGDLPDQIKLAAVFAGVPSKVLIDLPDIGEVITGRLQNWSRAALAEFGKTQANG